MFKFLLVNKEKKSETNFQSPNGDDTGITAHEPVNLLSL